MFTSSYILNLFASTTVLQIFKLMVSLPFNMVIPKLYTSVVRMGHPKQKPILALFGQKYFWTEAFFVSAYCHRLNIFGQNNFGQMPNIAFVGFWFGWPVCCLTSVLHVPAVDAAHRKTPPAPYRPSWAEHHDEPDWSEFPPQAEANAASYKHAPPFSLQDKYHQWQR